MARRGLLLFFLWLPWLGCPRPAEFEIDGLAAGDRIDVRRAPGAVVLDVHSRRGMGRATVRPLSGGWPDTVRLRLYLRGLEGLEVSNGAVTLLGSISTPDLEVRVSRRLARGAAATGERPLARGDALWMRMEVRGTAPGAPPRLQAPGAFVQVELPPALFADRRTSLSVGWIDYYRR